MKLALVCLLLSGCALGIPDAGTALPKVKPCQVWVFEEPEHRARCVTREEFNRMMRGVLY